MPYIGTTPRYGVTFAPEYGLYAERRSFLAAEHDRSGAIPPGFPTQVDSPSVWSGTCFSPSAVTFHLTEDEVIEIKEALDLFKESQCSLNELAPSTFRLPRLGTRLKEVSDQVFDGPGLSIIKGLPLYPFTTEETIIIHAGISSYVAQIRGNQSGFNDQVFHVCNREGGPITDLRSNSTADPIAFHSDDTDVLGFLVKGTAMSGGEMLWASHTQVYNDLAANRPEVLEVLAQDQWPFRTATPKGEPEGYVRMPLLYKDKKGPYFWLARGNLVNATKAQRNTTQLPQLTTEQADALDAVHFVALKHAVKITPERGDIYFLNNMSVLHSRTAFRDDEFGDDVHPSQWKRHLLRLWLRDPTRGREIHNPVMEDRWKQVFDIEAAKKGRWLTSRNMHPDVISHSLFKASLNVGTVSTSEH